MAEILTETIRHQFEGFLSREKLPESFFAKLTGCYLPLAASIRCWRDEVEGPLVVGINGAQGTGKSTLAGALALALEEIHQLKTLVVSIDDLYLTRSERARLSRQVHPLLMTRGVPGTHDVALGCRLFDDLRVGKSCAVPRFDKSIDDRAPKDAWTRVDAAVDVVLFEGWCIGARPSAEDSLAVPVNSLEAEEDPDGVWRRHVNEALAGPYASLFEHLHKLVLLRPPGFECVRDWRGEQEEKLRSGFVSRNEPVPAAVMDGKALDRFIMHYERLTRSMLEEMPSRADVVFFMNRERDIVEVRP